MNLSAGRRTILVGIDAPDWTRGFDPDVFALRVQVLLADPAIKSHAQLDAALSINPYAEWWQTAGIAGALFTTRYALMSAAAVWTDGTVSLERFARLFVTAFRDAGAGRDVNVDEVVALLISCDTTWNLAHSFGGSCISAPLTPRVVTLTIPASRSGYRLLTKTTRPQGVQDQPVPSGIAPTSLSPLPTQTPAPSITPAYSGTVDNPNIPDDPPGNTPNGTPKSSFPWLGVAAGATALVGGVFVVTVVRKRRDLSLGDGSSSGVPSGSRPNPSEGSVPTFDEYMAVTPKEFDRRNYGGLKGTFVWMGMKMPSRFREPADHGTMGDPYNGRVVPKKYLKVWQAGSYGRHYPDAPTSELAAAQAFVREHR
jgi:hypothetical protein